MIILLYFNNFYINDVDDAKVVSNSRDIKLTLMRDLVEVKYKTKEAVFKVMGKDDVTETYKVSYRETLLAVYGNPHLAVAGRFAPISVYAI